MFTSTLDGDEIYTIHSSDQRSPGAAYALGAAAGARDRAESKANTMPL